jgi:hypothetical protein
MRMLRLLCGTNPLMQTLPAFMGGMIANNSRGLVYRAQPLPLQWAAKNDWLAKQWRRP